MSAPAHDPLTESRWERGVCRRLDDCQSKAERLSEAVERTARRRPLAPPSLWERLKRWLREHRPRAA